MRGGALLPVVVAGIAPFLLLAVIIVASTLGLVAWNPPLLWTNQSDSTGVSVATDGAHIYVVGEVNYNGQSGTGTSFLRDYSTDGSLIWTRYVQNNSEAIWGVSIGADGLYFLDAAGNETLEKYSFDGNQLWGRGIGSGTALEGIASTSNAVLAFGHSDHSITNQTLTGTVLFVREYDLEGNVVWTNEFYNATSIRSGGGIAVGSSGVYVATNYVLDSYSFSGVMLWSHKFGTPPGLVPGYSKYLPSGIYASSSGVYLSGLIEQYVPVSGFLDMYDLSGKSIWNTTFFDPDGFPPGGVSMSTDSSGIYLSMIAGSHPDYVVKYDSNANQQWSLRAPQRPAEYFQIAAAPGRFYLAGETVSSQNSLVQAFSNSPSLVFFGVNPPYSFILLAALITVAVLSIMFFKRRYSKTMSKRPKSASPDRYRMPGDTLNRTAER